MPPLSHIKAYQEFWDQHGLPRYGELLHLHVHLLLLCFKLLCSVRILYFLIFVLKIGSYMCKHDYRFKSSERVLEVLHALFPHKVIR